MGSVHFRFDNPSGCRWQAGASPFEAERRVSIMSELYGRYHGQILALASRASANGRWKGELSEILRRLDNDRRTLTPRCSRQLAEELATQIEQEILQFADPKKTAVLAIALKHLDSM
jgi:phage-related baseplate assembly protein